MKKLSLKIVFLLLIIQNSFGQFHKFYMAQGFILSHGASITHIAMAGGGVVLKGVAKPKYPDSVAVFTNVTIGEAKGLSTLNIQTQESNISFSDSSWLMRDAAILVKSEKENEMYRDVNLFGHFTSTDYKNGYNEKSFYKVEMADSLRKTKSGQTLLYMDIILASDANTRYYSYNDDAYEDFIDSKYDLLETIKLFNDSVKDLRYKKIENMYFKLINFDSLLHSGKLNSSEITFLNKIKKYSFEKIDSLFRSDYNNPIDLEPSWNDYTYNDENTNYTFYYTKYDKHINIEGKPNYTFLYHNYSDSNDNDLEIDSVFTNYYMQHPDLIKNLNYVVVSNAENFSKIAAFYRYLKYQYPKIWDQVYTHYSHKRKTIGDTPGFIGIDPSDNY